MIVEFRRSFAKDLKKLRDANLLGQIQKVIERVEEVDNIQEVENVKKLKGSDDYYRIRVRDYRLGLKVQVKGNIAIFVRCLHRKDIYRYFP